jgi:hypothetical protein
LPGAGNQFSFLPRSLENLGLEPVAEAFFLHLQIVCGLEVGPEPIRGPEVARKPEGGVGRDGSKAVHDLVDPAGRYADVLRQALWLGKQAME